MRQKCPKCGKTSTTEVGQKVFKITPTRNGGFNFEGPIEEKLENGTHTTIYPDHLIGLMAAVQCKKCGHIFPIVVH